MWSPYCFFFAKMVLYFIMKAPFCIHIIQTEIEEYPGRNSESVGVCFVYLILLFIFMRILRMGLLHKNHITVDAYRLHFIMYKNIEYWWFGFLCYTLYASYVKAEQHYIEKLFWFNNKTKILFVYLRRKKVRCRKNIWILYCWLRFYWQKQPQQRAYYVLL